MGSYTANILIYCHIVALLYWIVNYNMSGIITSYPASVGEDALNISYCGSLTQNLLNVFLQMNEAC